MSWLQDHGWVVGVIVAAALALAGLAWWAARRPPPVPGAAAGTRGRRPAPGGPDLRCRGAGHARRRPGGAMAGWASRPGTAREGPGDATDRHGQDRRGDRRRHRLGRLPAAGLPPNGGGGDTRERRITSSTLRPSKSLATRRLRSGSAPVLPCATLASAARLGRYFSRRFGGHEGEFSASCRH
jgi:hypothetical protein